MSAGRGAITRLEATAYAVSKADSMSKADSVSQADTVTDTGSNQGRVTDNAKAWASNGPANESGGNCATVAGSVTDATQAHAA